MKDIHAILKQYWGYQEFRPLQEDVIRSILNGNDTLALMPTGGGKSLCYQVPAMAKEGLCLVISPLIALMKDQAENLRKRNITAMTLYSGMNWKEVTNTLKVVTESNCKFLFVSPERLETSRFREFLPGMGITLIAVDEAHCISQWGYDFRPPYLRIAALRNELPDVPVLALTASATKEVQEDICQKLQTPEHEGHWNIFRQSFERPRLSYSTFKVDSRINKIISILEKVEGTAIVYCKSRKRTREISELLQLQGINADFYHAGLSQEERNDKQNAWIADSTRVIVCTNAFGMGIDKPGVRTVIHADLPDCLENYYQEAGRAGRDGNNAYAVLLYDNKDLENLEKNIEIRFPPEEEIKNVYQAVANYLQLPAGSGLGEYFDFDLSDFLKKFKLPASSTIYGLKTLEQEGLLSFNEQVFLPPRIRFQTDRNYLFQFEKDNPKLEPLIKILLRAYEGVFDQLVNISEKQVAGLMHQNVEAIHESLITLDKRGIIEFQPQKDKPQILFLKNRVKIEELSINKAAYQERKKTFAARVRQMILYVLNETSCRSQMIGNYFGDKDIPACGICDNCLSKKHNPLTTDEFNNLLHRIMNMVKFESMDAKDLLARLKNTKKEKAMQVIDFLQAEDKIEMDEKGWLKLKALR